MNADEYRAAIGRLDLTQVGAARVLNVNERTSRRWAETGGVPRSVEIALILMGLLGRKKLERLGILPPASP